MLARVSKLHVLLVLAVLGSVQSANAEPQLDERSELLRQLSEYKQRVREVEERLRRLDARKAPVPKKAVNSPPLSTEACGNPFTMDSSGVKRVRPECMEGTSHQVSCAAPFEMGENGIKRVRDACSTEVVVDGN